MLVTRWSLSSLVFVRDVAYACLCLCLSVPMSLSLCVFVSVSLSLSLCPRLYPRSGHTKRWRLPCSTHLSPAFFPEVRVLVVALVAVEVIVVGLLFLLLILIVLLFAEPSVDAIVVSLPLSLFRPLPSCARLSVLSWAGHVLGDGASRVLSLSPAPSLPLCLWLSLHLPLSLSLRLSHGLVVCASFTASVSVCDCPCSGLCARSGRTGRWHVPCSTCPPPVFSLACVVSPLFDVPSSS